MIAQDDRGEDADGELVAEQRDARDAAARCERLADLVAVGPSLGRGEQQEAVAQSPAHQVGGDHAHQQRGQHLGHVAPEAQHTGDARPDGAADDAECQRDEQRQRSGPADAHTHVRGEHRADHELSLLADVHQAGATADGGAEGDEQDRCRDAKGEPPAPGLRTRRRGSTV